MANNIKINNPLGAKPQQQKGSGFVNLNKILQANVGNKLGETVSGGLNQGTQQVQQGLGQVKNQFLQESDKGNLATVGNQQAVSDALKNIAAGQSAVTDDQVKQFGTFLGGQYGGPKELDTTKTLQLGNKAQEVQGLGQSLMGGADKTRLLQTFAGKGPYSAGQTRLDSLLLGQGPNAKQQLAQARQSTRGLTQQIGKEQDIAQQIGQLRTGQAREFGQETGRQLTEQEMGINTALQKALEQAPIQREQLRSQYEQGLINQDLSQLPPEVQEQLKGLRTYNTNPLGALQLGQEATQQNIASLTQRGQLEALTKLAQKDPSRLGFAEDVYDPSKAMQINVQKLRQLAGEGERAYNDKLNAAYYKPVGSGGQSSNPEMQQLLDKQASIGLSIPEKIRFTELQAEGTGPGNFSSKEARDEYIRKQKQPYLDALQAFQTREGYNKQFK